MASRSSHQRADASQLSDDGQLSFSDILRSFNNPINEEQAWAVCYQCSQCFLRDHSQDKFQILYEHGLRSVCLNREGDIVIRSPGGPNGSGKGPPGGEYYPYRKRHATEHDAVQTLGRIIFEALDYGIGEAEERSLSHGLEVLIDTMTRSPQDTDGEGTDNEGQSADDEGIEKDAGEEPAHCAFRDVLRLCTQHLSRGQDASYHYRAVCRALLAEAVELHTFLDKVALSREKLKAVNSGQDSRLLELERADWARLWMQVVRSLRQGVRLKKNEHEHVRRGQASQPPVEFELTPFEMLLDDIRSRRYTLHKIMVNGDIPPKVKNDAHAVILDFIRSRPPLRQVKDRKLKSLPPKPPDPLEQLLQDIRAQPKLRPVRDGRLVDNRGLDNTEEAAENVETSRTRLNSEDSPPPARKIIKPDFNLLLTNSFEQESEEDSELDSPERANSRSKRFSPLSSPAKDAHNMNATWHLGGGITVGAGSHDVHHGTKLQRRHTIMVCESPTESKLGLQELPPLEEVEEPSPSEEQTPRLHRGSNSPLSGLPDHTLHNGHTILRGAAGNTSSGGGGGATRHQGALYRSEHRRSLTMGLTAIPEVEDASDSAGGIVESVPVPSRRHSMPAAPLSHAVGDGNARSNLGMGLEDRVHSAGIGLARRGDGGHNTLKGHFHTDSRHNGEGVGSGVKVVRAKGGNKSEREGVTAPCSQGDCAAFGRRPLYKEDEDEAASGDQSRDLALLSASEMMHYEIQKRWQNPIECLSLTLEEVTHIRSVLTKAELESLISHSDLYNLVAKNKVCFTCKTIRFTLFGEWGTKCKFCRRTVCSKCMRKMHVPTESFKNIPVYTLSPTPLTKEAQTLIQNYVKTGSSIQPATPAALPVSPPTSSPASIPGKLSVLDQQKGKRPLQRSQSMTLPTTKKSAAAASAGHASKSPLMNICCDCKGMIMEIIRASKTTLAMLQPPGARPELSGNQSPLFSSSSTSVSSRASSGSGSSSN